MVWEWKLSADMFPPALVAMSMILEGDPPKKLVTVQVVSEAITEGSRNHHSNLSSGTSSMHRLTM